MASISFTTEPIQLGKKRGGKKAPVVKLTEQEAEGGAGLEEGEAIAAAAGGGGGAEVTAGEEAVAEAEDAEIQEDEISELLRDYSELEIRELEIEYHYDSGNEDGETLAAFLVRNYVGTDMIADTVANFQYRPGFQSGGGGSKSGWQNAATRRLKKETDDRTGMKGRSALHHKLSRKRIKELPADFRFLANHPANYVYGVLPEHRSDDPGEGFDPNYEASGARTPRSEALAPLTRDGHGVDPRALLARLEVLHAATRGDIMGDWEDDGSKKKKRGN
ncbi:MAG: hypothetical protein MRZ79_20035 [Bacteroidia bacterium]|nr:hypothetical protein [Bacteroidia bacterium]